MTDIRRPSLLDPAARAVVDRLLAMSRRQLRSLLPYYLPRLPAILLGLRVPAAKDISFFDDKLLPIERAQGDLLYLLARASKALFAVEFGTSFGVSTIYLAAGLRDAGAGGQVVGTELVAAKAARARANLAEAGLAKHASILEGDARETLRDLRGPIDLLLLDGWPTLAGEVLQILEPDLADGAVIVIDNVAHFRRELGPLVDRMSHAPYRATLLPFKSGTLVAVYGGRH